PKAPTGRGTTKLSDFPGKEIASPPSADRNDKEGEGVLKAITLKTEEELQRFEPTFRSQAFDLKQQMLGVNGWRLEEPHVQALLEKIKKAGVPLEEYVEGKIYRGIITGYNEAFVIGEETKKRLIKEDKKSAEVIKPLLRGRDVKRYSIDYQNLYLIYISNGWTNEHRKKQEPEMFLKAQLPKIYQHLKGYEKALRKRDDQGEYWWELRPCTYLDEFAKMKIVYPNILKRPEFTFDTEGYYTNQKCFFTPIADKYLLAFLNSSVSMFLFQQLLPKLQGDFFEPSYLYFKTFPIAAPTESQRRAIEGRVEKILVSKKSNPSADTAKLEREIDEIVYEIYGLTKEEIAIVEGK
ncbi:MAG: TaqI-like C-terminal specificity domain-containing protein, partial [Bacteroidota bacterium]